MDELYRAAASALQRTVAGRPVRLSYVGGVIRIRLLLEQLSAKSVLPDDVRLATAHAPASMRGLRDALSFVVRRDAEHNPRFVVRRCSGILIEQPEPLSRQPWCAQPSHLPPLPPPLVVRCGHHAFQQPTDELQLPEGACREEQLPALLQRGCHHTGVDNDAMKRLCFATDEPCGFGSTLFRSTRSTRTPVQLVDTLLALYCSAGPLTGKSAATLLFTAGLEVAGMSSLGDAEREQLQYTATTRSVEDFFDSGLAESLSFRLLTLLQWWRARHVN
jgi:hypothetical protein